MTTPTEADCFLWQTGYGGPDAAGVVWIEADLYAIADLGRLLVVGDDGLPLTTGDGRNVLRGTNLPKPLARLHIEGLESDTDDQFLQKAYTAARAKLAEAQANQAAAIRANAFRQLAVLVPRA